MQTCPVCKQVVTRLAMGGGTLFRKPRYIYLSKAGHLRFGCHGCGAELERSTSTGDIVVLHKLRFKIVPSPSSGSAGANAASA